MATAETIRLAGQTLKETRHICAFFNSQDERDQENATH